MHPAHGGFFLFSILALALMLMSFFAAYHDQPSSCESTPATPHHYVLHATHNDYKLYLYRSPSQQVMTKPVLFIPGHAGSFRQVEPLASEAATHLDMFTVDLNEELTALDGRHVLTQAQFINHCLEMIVGLYPPGVKVDLVGHSMGGIVARLANPSHINTLVTFSTPHASPPVPIDPVLSDLYTTPNPAITIISIAGGARDTTIHSETAVVDHGLTVFTTSIPGVWTSLGHNEILTCHALLQRVVSGLVQDTLKDVLTLGDTPTPPGNWTLDGTWSFQDLPVANKTLIKAWNGSMAVLMENARTKVSICRHTLCVPIEPSLLPHGAAFLTLTTHDDDIIAFDQGKVWVDTFSGTTVLNTSIAELAWRGLTIPLTDSLYTRIQLPNIASPLLAYHLIAHADFLRYSIHSIHESRFVSDLSRTVHITLHDAANDGLWLELWHTSSTQQLVLTVDWYFSWGRSGIRHGILVVPFSFSVVLLVFAGQYYLFHRTGVFPSFGDGLLLFYRRTLPVTLLCLVFFVPSGWLPMAMMMISSGLITGLAFLSDALLRSSGGGGVTMHPRRPLLLFVCLSILLIPPSVTFCVFFIVHIHTCLRAYKKSQVYGMTTYHYMHTILVLLLTILPVQVPHVVVWLRDDRTIGVFPGMIMTLVVAIFLVRLAYLPPPPLPRLLISGSLLLLAAMSLLKASPLLLLPLIAALSTTLLSLDLIPLLNKTLPRS